MNFHEYQAKDLFAQYAIPVPKGELATTADEAIAAAKKVGGSQWVVKAQVHAGGRGKAGGVKLADSLDAVKSEAERMLGMNIETYQTGGLALPVNSVLIAEATDIEQELYLGALIDRTHKAIVFMGSAAGGVDIEQVAAETPDKIITETMDTAAGFMPYQARKMGFKMGLDARQVGQLTKIMAGLYRLFVDKDISLIGRAPSWAADQNHGRSIPPVCGQRHQLD